MKRGLEDFRLKNLGGGSKLRIKGGLDFMVDLTDLGKINQIFNSKGSNIYSIPSVPRKIFYWGEGERRYLKFRRDMASRGS